MERKYNNNNYDFEYLYWTKHFSPRLAVINVCPVLVPSELLLSTHLQTSEGWTTELTVGLWLVVPTTGFEPTRVHLVWFETLLINHSATPHCWIRHLIADHGTRKLPINFTRSLWSDLLSYVIAFSPLKIKSHIFSAKNLAYDIWCKRGNLSTTYDTSF